jgi:hypothetical protein
MSNQLVVHAGGERVTRADLKALPAPEKLGRIHKPIPHFDLVCALEEELAKIGLSVAKEDLAIANEGSRIFGVFDLAQNETEKALIAVSDRAERGLAMGFRNANDQAFALSVSAGTRVFVCDNMAFTAKGAIILHTKHTLHVNLHRVVADGMDTLVSYYGDLEKQVQRLKDTTLTAESAKAFLIDAFCKERAPLAIKYLPRVWRWYDEGKAGEVIVYDAENKPVAVKTPDCEPRTLWGLNNAFTRTVKELASANGRYQAGLGVGRLFGTRQEQEAEDAEYVTIKD